MDRRDLGTIKPHIRYQHGQWWCFVRDDKFREYHPFMACWVKHALDFIMRLQNG